MLPSEAENNSTLINIADIIKTKSNNFLLYIVLKKITTTHRGTEHSLTLLLEIIHSKRNLQISQLVFVPCGESFRCRHEADTSSAAGWNKGIDRNRKPRKRSLWYPGALKGIKQKKWITVFHSESLYDFFSFIPLILGFKFELK